jgi:hypothetical protein
MTVFTREQMSREGAKDAKKTNDAFFASFAPSRDSLV